MQDKGVPEKYIRLVKDMYHQCETVVRCAAGTSEHFAVEVGLHKGNYTKSTTFQLLPGIASTVTNMNRHPCGQTSECEEVGDKKEAIQDG